MLAQILLSAFLASGGTWNFEADPAGQLPKGWETRGNSRLRVYQVRADPDGNHYLSAKSQGSDVQLGIQLEAPFADSPVLSWRWRASELQRVEAMSETRKLSTARHRSMRSLAHGSFHEFSSTSGPRPCRLALASSIRTPAAWSSLVTRARVPWDGGTH